MAYAGRLRAWLDVAHFPGATFNKIQVQLRRYFTRCGAPEQISTDGGTKLGDLIAIIFGPAPAVKWQDRSSGENR